uniref:Uncharacterized protein n=1 Tax=Magallana gigas TaxID=29159 RepID=A0A8W8M9S1_MAGGI|nr:uncharacterized protein LOC105343880 isoform X2 [Crassostrea gigas]
MKICSLTSGLKMRFYDAEDQQAYQFQYLHLKDKENTSIKPIVSSRDWEQFTYFSQQLTQLSNNLRGLVSDEGQEQRHLDYIKAYAHHCCKKDNPDFVTKIQELEGMHSANCLQKEELENCINRAIQHLFKIKKVAHGDLYGKKMQDDGNGQSIKVNFIKEGPIKAPLQERNK